MLDFSHGRQAPYTNRARRLLRGHCESQPDPRPRLCKGRETEGTIPLASTTLPALGVPTTFCRFPGATAPALTTCVRRSRVGATLSRTTAFAQYRRERQMSTP